MLNTITRPIEKEMAMFNSYFESQFKSDLPLLDSALRYVNEGTGKKMRPILLLLVAKYLGNLNIKMLASASAMEMLHTASLLHDDVIDESDKRRGRPSVNVAYNNSIAVLVGDYILSQSLNNAATTRDYRIVEELSILGKALTRGELMQLDLQRNGSYSEENYISVIKYKTASLFVCCCACAVYSADADTEMLERFKKFGENIGICFQIKDDLFDYYSNDVGKPTGSDMREGKITLPALYVLENSNNPILEPIRAKLTASQFLDENEIGQLIRISIEEGGIGYAENMIERYRSEALALLPDDISDELIEALTAYIDYVIKRDK
ncbi:MAG: polyprenyl synthetase family protein [Bacteroidaceae bacterium]|nr:polyprenyl synthetase family protein [Bacteroidaceae bacterium]